MKIKLLFFVCTISFISKSFSQDYQPFLNHSNWIVRKSTGCCVGPWYKVITEGTEEVIGGYTYTKFTDPYPFLGDEPLATTVYVREDVATKKVYKIKDGADLLIYDFSMELDQTISQYGYTFKVTAVDMVDVLGTMRKQITLRSIELFQNHYSLKQVWVEGVGGPAHPFYPDRNMKNVASASGGIKYTTYCGFQDGVHVYGTGDCPEMLLGTTEETNEARSIDFTPNPFTTQLAIDSNFDLHQAAFKLYNLQGQLVKEIGNLNGKRIILNRDNLANGLYLGQLLEEGKLIKTVKLAVN